MSTDHPPKPAAWGITHNPDKFAGFDPFRDDNVVIPWSLADNYRTRDQMAQGDRVVFWETGEHSGIARIGFVLSVHPCPDGFWEDEDGERHEAVWQGTFFLPPFPRGLYIARRSLLRSKRFSGCELVAAGRRQAQPPLRIEAAEWDVIERAVVRLDRRLGGATPV